MTNRSLRIATRTSELAIWQAEHVAGLLRSADPELEITLVPVVTHGDKRLDVPIAEIGGKGVFAKEVQRAVLDGHADVAVHSAKDLTAVTVEGLVLAAVPVRGDARDALAGRSLHALRPGSVVGTGSARRAVQLRALRDDLEIVGLRGNIATRLARLEDLDAIVVAVAALERLGLDDRIAQCLEITEMIPQVAQGALAIECRANDETTIGTLRTVEDEASRMCVDAERAFLARLGGDCDLPAGAYATLTGEQVHLVGVLASDDAATPVRRESQCAARSQAAIAAGAALAEQLLATVDAVGR